MYKTGTEKDLESLYYWKKIGIISIKGFYPSTFKNTDQLSRGECLRRTVSPRSTYNHDSGTDSLQCLQP